MGLEARRVEGRTLYRAEGCSECSFTGYRGRVGVYELLELDSTLRDMTFRSEPTLAIRQQAERSGRMSTLREDGIRKVLAGVTTIPEVLTIVAATGELR